MEISEAVVQMQKDVSKLNEEMTGLRKEMNSEFKNVREEMNSEFKNVREEMNSEFKNVRQEMKQMSIKMEVDIERKLDIILDYITLQQEEEKIDKIEKANLEERVQKNELKILNHENRIDAIEKNSHLQTIESY